ncbi:DHA2 family efflux MFS transporter permease subunit [Kitasatospora sp. LaBMicrA B282]|uniref:DHA2 family efflux MFS transporter permease subunit n=1 Tax=Kitasatospora sp. LaBMicrA B282 TaxID=3420949 RepID=UPI003D0F3E64
MNPPAAGRRTVAVAPTDVTTGSATGASATAPSAASAGALAGIVTVVVIGSVMSVLDMTIVNVALRPLATAFRAPLADVQWIATGYTLALTAVTPLAAWALGRFGGRSSYLTAVTLFTAGSLLAALAWSPASLVLFRVCQGLGGGLLMPLGMAMVLRAAGRERMGRAMALLGIPVLVGPVSGPVLGGWLIDTLSWRWIFLVNLPVGALALVLAARLLPRESARTAERLDLPGLLTLSPGLALLIYGLATGGAHGSLTAPGALLPALAGLLLIAGFLRRALTTDRPLLRLGLFGNRTFAAGAATMLLAPAGYFGAMLLTPMYYQAVRGLSPTAAGLLGAPLALAVGTSMQLATRRVGRGSPRYGILTGILLAVLGLALFTAPLGAHTPYRWLCAAQLVLGTGIGMVLMPTNTTATRALAAEEIPFGSTLLSIVSQVGSAAGTALLSVVLAARSGSGGAGAPTAAAFRDTYWWAVALLALAAVPALLLPARPGDRPPVTARRR